MTPDWHLEPAFEVTLDTRKRICFVVPCHGCGRLQAQGLAGGGGAEDTAGAMLWVSEPAQACSALQGPVTLNASGCLAAVKGSTEANLQLWSKSTLQQETASRQAGTAVQHAQAASPAGCSCIRQHAHAAAAKT